jgi:hypothetical protein
VVRESAFRPSRAGRARGASPGRASQGTTAVKVADLWIDDILRVEKKDISSEDIQMLSRRSKRASYRSRWPILWKELHKDHKFFIIYAIYFAINVTIKPIMSLMEKGLSGLVFLEYR